MARSLARLGQFSSRRPWLVIGSWVVVLVIAIGGFAVGGGQLSSGFSIPNTPTQQVADRLQEKLDGVGGAVGTVVFQTDDDAALSDDQQAEISELVASIAGLERVAKVVDPFETAGHKRDAQQKLDDSAAKLDDARAQLDAGQEQLDAARGAAEAAGRGDASAAQFEEQQASIDEGLEEIETSYAQLDVARELFDNASAVRTVSEDETTAAAAIVFDDSVADLSKETKLAVTSELDTAEISGVTINYSREIASSFTGLLGAGEIVGLLIAALVLVVMLRSLIPAMVPLVSSLVGVGVGVAGSLAFSGVVDMDSVTPVLGVMLGLAVGIDYTLFIINRHRRQLLAGAELRNSIGLANGTAGNAVVFAGSTVIIALLALAVTGIPFLGVMGTVAAACVLIAVLVAVTFTPALLGLVGMRVLNKRARASIGHAHHVSPDVSPMRTWRAALSVVVAVSILLVAAIPALSLRLGLPDGSSESEDSTAYRTYSIVADKFGAGTNGALIVTAEPGVAVDADDQVAVQQLQVDVGRVLMQQDNVVAVTPAGVSSDGELLAFQVVPADGPSSVTTEGLVGDLRAIESLDSTDNGAVELGIAGQATGNIDISQSIGDALPLYLLVVIGLSLLIMVLVFRSILVPLVATVGFLLSLFAALGAVTAIYQWGWFGQIFGVHDPGPVLSFAPIILTGVLFGLAMDYQLFIGSGMREAFAHGAPPRIAVTVGVRGARAVVVAAAIIMISVFGGFIFSHTAMIRPLGFGLAMGVLFDAFVVRLVVMPSIMHLLGASAWWLPRWLDRILPDVDIEGASLERHHLARSNAAAEADAAAR